MAKVEACLTWEKPWVQSSVAKRKNKQKKDLLQSFNNNKSTISGVLKEQVSRSKNRTEGWRSGSGGKMPV
jgi:hypothetical protein